VAVNWSGDIQSLETNAVIASVPKQRVSAFMLSQQIDQRQLNRSVSVP